MKLPKSQFILGGQKSGKSRYAEQIASRWLGESDGSSALLIATAKAFDQEMQERIDRHQADRLISVPKMSLIEEPLHLGKIIREQSSSNNLIVIDCLTIWLTNLLMPHPGLNQDKDIDPHTLMLDLIESISHSSGPIVLISNEIGLGVIPMGREIRAYVDELGRLNQQVSQVCEIVTLMAAGIPLHLKGVI